jgi:RNA polymerase sigma-70 factor, ECF subfamily
VSDDDARIPEHYAAEVARFFEAHARWLFGHACLRTGRDRELAAGRELAADLVQDTFEAAALAWETLRELSEAQQRAWLRTTLAHKETSHFRRRVTFRRKQADLHHRYKAADADTEHQALSAIALAKAAEIIEGLPAAQKRIALMRWNDHMKGAEIAAELGCAEGTVAAQIHEIRRKLIKGLGPYYPFAGDDGEGEASR